MSLATPFAVGLGGGLALWHLRSAAASPRSQVASAPAALPVGTWVFPVPSLDERPAVVSNPFKASVHLGVDIMSRRRDARDLIATYPPGSSNGTRFFFIPNGVPALAASVGAVTFAADTPVGRTVIIRHASNWTTYYTHLSTLDVVKGQEVTAGQTLGTIGASPKDGQRLVHLHFELWQGRVRAGAVDPSPFLAAWSRVQLPAAVVESSSLRNGSLTAYRPVGDRGEPYPEWVRSLRGQSGVYVFREIGGPIVYVGSSVGRLYDTLTRHFQTWRRYKGFWRGQFAEGADPGLTYPRGSVEVAVKITSADVAHEEELRTIRRLQPRDNQIGQPELAAAPF